MCFSPQRRAIFQHLNFKKWSEHAVFCTFSLQNVLLATAACNFSTSQLQKVVRTCSVLYIFTSKCASRHSGVQFLISSLTTWLRTRRFTEPTFRLTRHTNHWKNTAFRDFSNIWRGCIFFLLTFAQLHLLSSDSTFSSDFTFFWLYFISSAFHLCFSTLHIVGSLLFKLPSNSTIESVITVGSSNTPNSTFVSTCSNNFGLSFFAEAFFGLDLAVASVEPRCVSRCVIGEMMPQTAAEVLKKKQRVRKLKKSVAVPIWIRVWLVSNVGLSRCFNRNDKMDLWWTRQTKSIPCWSASLLLPP